MTKTMLIEVWWDKKLKSIVFMWLRLWFIKSNRTCTLRTVPLFFCFTCFKQVLYLFMWSFGLGTCNKSRTCHVWSHVSLTFLNGLCDQAGHLKYNLSKSRKVILYVFLALLSFLPLIATCLGFYSPEIKPCCQQYFPRCLIQSLTLMYLINNSDQRHGSLSPCAFIVSSELRWKTWPCLALSSSTLFCLLLEHSQLFLWSSPVSTAGGILETIGASSM